MNIKPFALFSCLVFFILLSSNSLFAQSYTISGYVTEKGSGEKLLSATVYNSINFSGTSTNDYGFYSLTLPGDSVIINYSYIGYITQQKKFVSKKLYIAR